MNKKIKEATPDDWELIIEAVLAMKVSAYCETESSAVCRIRQGGEYRISGRNISGFAKAVGVSASALLDAAEQCRQWSQHQQGGVLALSATLLMMWLRDMLPDVQPLPRQLKLKLSEIGERSETVLASLAPSTDASTTSLRDI